MGKASWPILQHVITITALFSQDSENWNPFSSSDLCCWSNSLAENCFETLKEDYIRGVSCAKQAQ
jgi:hypothetical protein